MFSGFFAGVARGLDDDDEVATATELLLFGFRIAKRAFEIAVVEEVVADVVVANEKRGTSGLRGIVFGEAVAEVEEDDEEEGVNADFGFVDGFMEFCCVFCL